ncbi:DoxX family protein [Hymenobacter sp. BT683]|uniref:DoxX family protein n=1 Tax=Hymenobacter jeongseonensis TaxID=2791027 RepID=A0ABS0II07_9BACT|nr:DoxX family protein [Hymenobacter jeongseonensis]MBF9237976.1 DoxX family protein [Hymenobacter jeongseonensis]
MKNSTTSLAAWRGPAAAFGLLVFRLHLGVVMVEAGLPKLEPSDWFTSQVANLGFTWPSPEMWAWLAAWGEFAGGILLVVGLGTRLAAAQLSVQFFVISFLWYDKPEFFTGMYVQQEMFWGFVLLLATGAGKWSLDYWLRTRVWPLSVRKAFFRKATIGASAAVLAAVLLASPAMAGCAFGSVHSDLIIEPGKQFVLGGDQRGAFKVVARNKGKVAVEIKERPRNGGIFGKITLAPGQQGVVRFAEGSTAVLLNPSASQANLDLKITGDTNLRMASEPVVSGGVKTNLPRLTGAELSDALADWQGTLTYLNYTSQRTVTLNTVLRGQMTRPDQLLLRFDYEEPNKTHVFGTDTLAFLADGAQVRWDGIDYLVQSKEWLPSQTLRLVLEGQGQDDNRAATIRKTLTLSPHRFIVKKEVRFSPDSAFLQRNQYSFAR